MGPALLLLSTLWQACFSVDPALVPTVNTYQPCLLLANCNSRFSFGSRRAMEGPRPPGGSLSLELNDGSRSHLYRHVSEITRETKGGYLQGQIRLPQCNSSQYLRLSVIPTAMDGMQNPFHLHPNLLHINMKTNKKNRLLKDGELPEDVDWSFVFYIDGDVVYRVCPSDVPELREKRFHLRQPSQHPANLDIETALKRESARAINKAVGMEKPSLHLGHLYLPSPNRHVKVAWVKNGCIELGSAGLMLNIITPLQKYRKGGTTLSDVLRQRFMDLFSCELSDSTLHEVEAYYTKQKDDRVKMHKVFLLAELFSVDDHLRLAFLGSAMSKVITNSKSKECGPLHLYDVNPAVSCCESQTKIFMLSFFKLTQGIQANFVICEPNTDRIVNNDHYELFKKIRQPEDCTVFNQCVIIFTAPKQDPDVVREIYSKGYVLKVSAFRVADRKMSSTKFEFRYQPHLGDNCIFCALLCSVNEVKDLPVAKPGVHRRVGELYDGSVWDKANEEMDTSASEAATTDFKGKEETLVSTIPASINSRIESPQLMLENNAPKPVVINTGWILL